MKRFVLGKKLLFITAHPDDESYASAGTIWANYIASGESFVICATFGEKGRSHLLKPLTLAQLKKKRKAEIQAACRFLKVKQLFLLDLPDGGVKNHRQIAFQKILPVVRKIKPDCIISFGKDGMSGHLDHIAIGEIARKISQRERIPFIAYAPSPARVKLLRRSPHIFKSRRKHGKYARKIIYSAPNIKIKVSAKIKIKAVGFHKSQLGGKKPYSHLPEAVKKEWLKHEYFGMD